VGQAFEGIAPLAREVAASGAVMLKNDGALPLGQEPFALFGRTQVDTFYVGYGSGGDVRAPYRVSILQGILNNPNLNPDKELIDIYTSWCKQNPVDHGFWAHWPWRYPEMPLSSDVVAKAKARANKAVVILGRAAGEDRENKLEQGSFFLHDEELNMLDTITAEFDNVIVLMNIGNVIDFSWLKRYGDKIKGLLIVWQGGMETGNAVADVLSGNVSPDGKLPMAIANTYNDYPSSGDFGDRDFNFYSEDVYVGYRYFETFNKDAVLYPFGYGISYSNFVKSATVNKVNDGYEVIVDVKNVGAYTARETVQIYLSAPQGKLGKPAVVLVGYNKTNALAPNESETVKVKIPYYLMSSYDDSGVTGNKCSYVLEEGNYDLYVGNDCRDIDKIFSFNIDSLMVVNTVTEAGAPQIAFDRLRPVIEDGKVIEGTEPAPLRTVNLKERIIDNLPKDIPYTGNKGYKLIDVKNGKIDLDTFVAQLTNRELEAISRGDYTMHSKLGAKGNAGAMAGTLKSMRQKGIPAVITSDGPSGMRLAAVCSLAPIGTLLSATWDAKLIEKLYSIIGKEMIERGSDVLLAPGMN
ncbi:MAG: glycoside hydrolase family 3 protein, partial [Clostridia bacterium]|nr:glycoside hydrolase family 3 protein [Clostridia bacterium]